MIKSTQILKIGKYLLASLFMYAGAYKLVDVELFNSQMAQSPLLPPQLIPYIAILLPILEIILGLLLVLYEKIERQLLWISFSLMLFFSAYLTMLYTLYSKPPCACGGILANLDYPAHIVFNLVFTLIALLAVIKNAKIKKSTNR